MNDAIILVNNDDKEIGYGEKLQVHLQGQLHRAFSLFIVNKDYEVLIQKRAYNKYHSGGVMDERLLLSSSRRRSY